MKPNRKSTETGGGKKTNLNNNGGGWGGRAFIMRGKIEIGEGERQHRRQRVVEINPFGWQWMDSSHPGNTEGSCMWLMCIPSHRLAHVSLAPGSRQTLTLLGGQGSEKVSVRIRRFSDVKKKKNLWHFYTIFKSTWDLCVFNPHLWRKAYTLFLSRGAVILKTLSLTSC